MCRAVDNPAMAPLLADPAAVRILLVDDTPQNLLALEAMLGNLDLDPAAGGRQRKRHPFAAGGGAPACGEDLLLVRAESGAEALRRVLQDDFAVILLDVLMPGMDGLETAALIRARERSRDTPIIFITAAGRDEDLIARGYALGAVDYIVKPIQPAILRSKVAVFVELFRKTAQVREQAAALACLNADLEERVRARTAQLQAAQAAAERERDRLRQVLDVLPEAVLVTDADGRVLSSNAAATEIVGLDMTDRPLAVADPEALDSYGVRHLDGTPMGVQSLPLRRSLAGAIVHGTQLLVRNARVGCDVPILMNSAPLRDASGTIGGVVAVFQDISALKSLERQKDEFLASVSHDLKNPLTTIRGMAQVLRHQAAQPEGVDAGRLRDGLEAISGTAVQMAALLTELLELTRLRMERPLDLAVQPAELVALIQRMVVAHQQATERHTIQIQSTLSELQVRCDPARVERVLSNLLSNALKYSPQGGTITVALSREDDAVGTWAVLQVCDRGLGIPVEDLPHVFERFYRGRNVASTTLGTGLGLPSVLQIVEQHGGAVAATCNPDGGTMVTVWLPVASAHPALEDRGDAASEAIAPPPQRTGTMHGGADRRRDDRRRERRADSRGRGPSAR